MKKIRINPRQRHQPHQRGQALVWFLATVAASAAVFYGVYNVGQITAAKQKVVNATDAAALAGANQQARMLNFMAYNNRAMIAADVVVAQAVSLDSWLLFVHQTTQNSSVVLRWVPYVGAALSQISDTMEEVEEKYRLHVVPRLLNANSLFKTLLTDINTAVRATGGLLSNVTAHDVLAANRTVFNGRTDFAPQPNAGIGGVTVGANLVAWSQFSAQFANNDRGRAREVLLSSVDAFSSVNGRNGNGATNRSLLAARVEKRGTTQLAGFDRWEAQDSWDLRTRGCGPFGLRWCGDNATVPLGWGRADAYNNQATTRSRIGSTNAQRIAYFLDPQNLTTWSGVPVLTDLSVAARNNPQLSFISVSAKPTAHNRTSTALGMAPQPMASVLGSAHMPEQMLSNQVNAISEAVVYFERPQKGIGDWTAAAWGSQATLHREDNTKEFASLFNPFWQARLAPVSLVRKNLLIAALGEPALAAINTANLLP